MLLYQWSSTPYLLSPPNMPKGRTPDHLDKDTGKVLMYHGLTYSHPGLTDVAVMLAYVSRIAEKH